MALIMVVDDESYIRGFIAELLGEKHVILSAINGREGLALAQSLRAEAIELDLIITDLEMPIMSGWEMVNMLRQQSLKPLIIALSASFYFADRRAAMLAAGANCCLLKPINISLLEKRVTQLLQQTTTSLLLDLSYQADYQQVNG